MIKYLLLELFISRKFMCQNYVIWRDNKLYKTIETVICMSNL